MNLWVDDIRTPPEGWAWSKSSQCAIRFLTNEKIFVARGWSKGIEIMSLDHDLGGKDTTRYIVLWCINHDFWPNEVVVHSANPVGREWLEGMIERYK